MEIAGHGASEHWREELVARVPDEIEAAAAAVRAGLLQPGPKHLPPWLLYDARGSELFEEITALPEYYLTRTERAILAASASDIIDAAGGGPLEVVELGAGSASKTRLLLEALLARQGRATYVPVDVSGSALLQAARALRRLKGLTVRPVLARYPDQLGFLRSSGARRLVLFLGSNIGNYDPDAARVLLTGVRRHLDEGDAFLMGTDMRKSPDVLVPAYDDARGVTARFTKNVLARLNRDLGAHFDLDHFRHVALWNGAASRMELYLESLDAQSVRIDALAAVAKFAAGERIHIESSHKLTPATVRALLADAGMALESSFYDRRRWFGLHLALPV